MTLILLLGGTGEARELAGELAGRPGARVVTSLAGRVRAPRPLPGEVRVGGFGGPEGLAAWLRAEGVGVLVDATHPFADRISRSAVEAAGRTGVPLLVLRRPGWTEQPGDDWRRVPSVPAAAELLPRLGRRVLLTTGRQTIAAFAGLDEVWFLARSVDPPEPPLPRRLRVLLDRGPFTVDGELALLREHRVQVVVTKDSGGRQASAKLVAARRLGLPVVMVDRPAPATGTATVDSVAGALAWLTAAGLVR